jgi:hypothetical protein
MVDFRTRITPKFQNSNNYKNAIDFLTTYDTESVAVLREVNNMDSNYGFVLDEIGKTLGIYPRPFVPKDIDGLPTYFKLDLSKLDTVPLVNDFTSQYRRMSNLEYSRLLRAFAKGINFKGTIQEWEDIIFILTGAKCSISNQRSKFGLIIQKNLDIVQKAILEYALRYNSLTISLDFIGTTSGNNPFLLDKSQLDVDEFVSEW